MTDLDHRPPTICFSCGDSLDGDEGQYAGMCGNCADRDTCRYCGAELQNGVCPDSSWCECGAELDEDGCCTAGVGHDRPDHTHTPTCGYCRAPLNQDGSCTYNRQCEVCGHQGDDLTGCYGGADHRKVDHTTGTRVAPVNPPVNPATHTVRVFPADPAEGDPGPMFIFEALGVAVTLRERLDEGVGRTVPYVHVEAGRYPLDVEVENGGEHRYE